MTLQQLFRQIQRAIVGTPRARARPSLRQRRRRSERPYPAELGLTAESILRLLATGPQTTTQLDAAINTTTAGWHLPRLRERGLIESHGWPHVHTLTTLGALAIQKQ